MLVPVLALLIGMGIAGVAAASYLGGRIDAILRENYDSIIAMGRLTEALERLDTSFQFALSGEPTHAHTHYQASWPAYQEALRCEQRNITVPQEKELVEKLVTLTEQYRQQGDAFFAGASNHDRRAQEYFGPGGLRDSFKQIKSVSGQIVRRNEEDMKLAGDNARRTADLALLGFAIALTLAVLLSGLAGWHSYRTVRKELTERGKLEQSLRHAVAYNRRLIETSLDPLVTIGPDGKITDVNLATEIATGRTRAELVGTDFAEYFTEPERAQEGYRRAFSEGTVRDYPLQMRHRDGRVTPVLYNAAVFRDGIGNVVGVFAAARDISELQKAEEGLRRSNRALWTLSSCNQALIRAADETRLLQQVCQIVVEVAGYRLCWVGYADHDEAKTVRPVAHAGFDEGYLETVNITWADTERGRGPTGTAIRTGRTVLLHDLANDPSFAPWRDEATRRGYASCIAIPLIADSTTLGALMIAAAQPGAFSEEEVALLTELAGDLAFGVMNLRTRADRAAGIAREAARQREVEIGFKIQQMLLLDQPPVDLPGLQIAARTIPSRMVDGDFYAFYQHDKQQLDVIVADVMGKGIPAALLGAATRSQLLEAMCHLLSISHNGKLPQPREIVTLAHAEMVPHLLELESFVTLVYLHFDLVRRCIELVDCGHTGLIHRSASTGHCRTLHGFNLPLGVRADEVYKQLSVPFENGDLFLLFSDGVTESRNSKGELFGEKRLLQCVQDHARLEPDLLVEAIRRTVFDFAGSEATSDDWTCVAMKAAEPESPVEQAELEIRSDLAELRRAREFVRTVCEERASPPLDDTSIDQLELAITEACSNIIKHAYHGRPDQPIHLEIEVYPGKLSVRLYHRGDSFDPTKVPPPALDGSRFSGFGLYLISRSVDTVRYYRDDRGRNCVVLVKLRKTSPSSPLVESGHP